jgi:DNA-binding NarL/FixJ family response regulator
MIKVAICDDHLIVASGIKALLRYNKEITFVGEAYDAASLFSLLNEKPLDVLLMDIGLGEENGITLTAEVLKHFPRLRIIALTMQNDYTSIREMDKAGASGYLLKNSSVDLLCEAIKTVYEGGVFHSAEVGNILLSHMHLNDDKNTVKLSEREHTILTMMSNGLTTKAIAAKVFLSEDTVKWYRKNLLARFDQPNVAALIKWAVKHKLIE